MPRTCRRTERRSGCGSRAENWFVPLASAAEENRQSLSAFVVDRLAEVAGVVRIADYVSAYPPPRGTGVRIEDAVAAVREVREATETS